MEIDHLLQRGVEIIKGREYSNPVLEATLVLADLLNVDKIYIYIHGKDQVDQHVVDEFLEIMEKRSEGYPIQYLLNSWEFMGLDFHIEEGVLIPRPDTEILVEYILEYIDEYYKDQSINFLDLGIGSGAICLSVAHYKKDINVHGVDIYDTPLKVTEINREKFNLTNVKLHKGDLFSGIKGLGLENKFHIIASNPPYISKEDIKKLQREVKDHEPISALDGGVDGLDFYRNIVPESKKYLQPEGMLIFEIGYDQGPQVKDLMIDAGFRNVEILQDLQGLNRVVRGTLPQGSGYYDV